MLPKLTPLQARVIGVLLEKEITTPDQYPLSLNGLTTGCNQKSNREPVLSLSEFEVQDVLDELLLLKLVSDDGALGGRVVKYKHRFCNTEFGSFKLTEQQLGIVCVLLLRGPQTPGELRTRTNRLAEFANVSEVEAVLEQLQSLNGEAVVARLDREPGKRESRYMHLLSETGGVADDAGSGSIDAELTIDDNDRIASLEQQVAILTKQVQVLMSKVDNIANE